MKKTFITALLGCTMLAGCNNGDDRTSDNTDPQGTFNAKIEEANGRVSALTAEVQALNSANTLLGDQVAALKTADTAANTAVETLVKRTNELEAGNNAQDAAVSAMIGQLKSEIAELEKQRQEANSSMTALLAKVGTSATTPDLSAAIDQLKARYEEIEKKVSTANTKIATLESVHTADDTKIVKLQTALASLDQTAKSLKLETMQPHIADLQAELTKYQPNVAALAAIADRASESRARTTKVDRTKLSTEDAAAYDAAVQELATLEKDLAAKQAEVAATLAKGGAILKSIGELQADATSGQVMEIDGQITGLSTALKADTKPLQDKLAGYSKVTATLGRKVTELTGTGLAAFVNTTRGSLSERHFGASNVSRGNNFPATAVPFGFNMWSPVSSTDNSSFYDPNSKYMRAFAVTHEASKWNGNRQALKIMPVRNEGVRLPNDNGELFDRKNEVAMAHYYSVTFENKIKTEITPTDHAAYFRFTAPDTMAKTTIAFDTFEGLGSLKVDQAQGTASGYANHGSNAYTPKMYFFIKFDNKITNFQQDISPGDVRSWVQFDTPAGVKVVGMKMATSFISVEQAQSNLEQEIAAKSFDDVLALALAAWNEKLNAVRVEGATDDQKIILYSNLYRSFLYPNSAWENVIENGNPVPTYVSPYTTTDKIKKGKIWVNNGFWDTYRTTWPLYALLVPNQAGEMIDGFVNGFKDGGWTTRWSNPGYADSMVGTSSDIIIADAYMKGIRNFDIDAAYNSIVRNASTFSSNNDRGRKGMANTPFYGYSILSSESVSWSLEGYLNDFGLAQMAKAMNKGDDYAYFMNSAISYPNLFDNTSTGAWAGGFFRAKNSTGGLMFTSGTPQSWGNGFTEGNAWSYAFLAPQDGQGLANLYGGRQKLKDKLDTFFTTRAGLDGGSYGGIHEVYEAKMVDDLANVGEYQHSNQPVHHSIYMYNYAGSPSSGQKYLRDVMDKLYFTGFGADGVSNGHGYIGDEDNGEQSAWYVLSAMGFYPVSMGRPEYAIGAPYFPKMTVQLKNIKGELKKLVINAPNVSSSNRYVQSVKLNGTALTRNYLLHSELAEGATLDFEMGPNPSQWGTGVNDVPTSITQGDKKPTPLKSLLPIGNYNVTASTDAAKANVFDRTSSTKWDSPAGSAGWIEAGKKSSPSIDTVSLYTVTSTSAAGQDPTGWTLKGSNDGTNWVALDKRDEQTFQWRQQTRPFALKTPVSYSRYRLEFTGTNAVSVAEFELYGMPDAVPAPVAAAATPL
ncbi:alpha-1,2-mannosidase, putative [Phyllobacterium sp. YR620]|uniref:GH92 family glycosyl hydrolase n=1 Tax=Phyllobacterium sp. YR620 TaxID=1881066 RepID=UPI00088AC078|nr:GH92 family glycosyl hydrolase [Phyllobacterium sp. YR620]SDP35675.1 alpha-1,2-mannosidase, putative [Phyllobacterium sp. YR620]